MNKNLLIGLVIILLLLGGYFILKGSTQPASLPTPVEEKEVPSSTSVSLELGEQNDSGESGVAIASEVNGQVQILLSMDGAEEDIPQPAHIHAGTCREVGEILYPLTNVLNGESETVLNVTLDQLSSEMPLAINVHKSGPEADLYVSCGDFPL